METEGGQHEPNAFERWLEAALPPARVWRFALGVVLVLAFWFAFWFATPWVYYYGWIVLGDEHTWEFSREMAALQFGETHLAVVVLMICSAGFWVGSWVATKLHRQAFWSLVSPARRISWRWFAIGVLLSLGEFGVGWASSIFFPGAPARFNQPDIGTWAMFFLPIAALTFIQAGGEELFFRGYVMQWLAARFRSPLVWGALPAVAFGCLHFFNGVSLEHSLYYVCSTALFGLTAAITVWRTGDVSTAIGFHFATNVTAFLFFGADNMFLATPLWLVPIGDAIAQFPLTLAIQMLTLLFVLSPWGPKAQPARKNETRAAP